MWQSCKHPKWIEQMDFRGSLDQIHAVKMSHYWHCKCELSGSRPIHIHQHDGGASRQAAPRPWRAAACCCKSCTLCALHVLTVVITTTYKLPSYQAQVNVTQVNSLPAGLFWDTQIRVINVSCWTQTVQYQTILSFPLLSCVSFVVRYFNLKYWPQAQHVHGAMIYIHTVALQYCCTKASVTGSMSLAIELRLL